LREHKQRTHKVRSLNEITKGRGRRWVQMACNNQRKDKLRSKWRVKGILTALKPIRNRRTKPKTQWPSIFLFSRLSLILSPTFSQDTTKVQAGQVASLRNQSPVHIGIGGDVFGVLVTDASYRFRICVWQTDRTSGHQDTGWPGGNDNIAWKWAINAWPSLGRTNLAIGESTDFPGGHQRGFPTLSWLRYKY